MEASKGAEKTEGRIPKPSGVWVPLHGINALIEEISRSLLALSTTHVRKLGNLSAPTPSLPRHADLRRPAYRTMEKKLVDSKGVEDGGDFGAEKTPRKGSLASRRGRRSGHTLAESGV